MRMFEQHSARSTGNRGTGSGLLHKAALVFFALVLAFGMVPVQALAADSNTVEQLTIGSSAGTTANSATSSTGTAQNDAGTAQGSANGASGSAAAPAPEEEETTTAGTPAVQSAAAAYTTGEDEVIQIGTEPLNLIQNGNYSSTDMAANPSTNATSTGAAAPTTAQRNAIKARLNTALSAVSFSSYNGQSNWCVLDVKDLQAQLTTNSTSYAKALVEEVINENPELFYAGAQYGAGTTTITSSSGSKTVLSKILVQYYYSSSSTIKSMKTRFETAMENVLKWVPANGSDAQKAKAVHDWLVRNVSYHTTAANKGGPTGYGSWNPWNAYGAVVDKKAVCEGYSLAFMVAMKRVGITATFVTNSSYNHGWNRVRLYDTLPNSSTYNYYWFNLDITWDDPIPDKGFSNTPRTTYFLKSDSYFKNLRSKGIDNDATHSKWSPAGTAGTNTKYDGGWSGGTYSGNASRGSVTSLSLSPSALSIAPDSSQQLTLNVAQSGLVVAGEAKWTSSNPAIAAVSSSGLVTAGKNNGTATITVTLGGKTARCTVTVKDGIKLSNASVSLSSSTYAYKSGVSQRPTPTVKVSGKPLTAGTDYSITWPSDTQNPGTKTATITGKGDYTGTKTFTYTITGSLSSASVATSDKKTSYAYTGSSIKPTLVVKFGSTTLKEGTDYTVTWPSNTTSSGTKTATIRGKGAYSGTKTFTYRITATSISRATVTYSETMRYTGRAITQSPKVVLGGNTVSASNYTVSYKNNTNVGTATMTITGKGGFSGSITKSFKIVRGATWKRLFGSTQFDTMYQIVASGWSTSGTVLIATSQNFPDALSAAGVAGLYNAPVLITQKNKLTSQTSSILRKLKPSKVIIAGGPGAVSNTVANSIKSVTGVTPQRVYGQTATDTAAQLNKTFFKSGTSNTAILATSKSFYDALAAAPVSFAKHYPIFLVDNKTTISSSTLSAMKSCGIKQVIIAGGTSVVGPTIVSKLKSNGITVKTRLWGNTYFDTAKAIADWGVKNGMTANNVGIATAKSYYDALCGAALCGKNNAVLVLADTRNSSRAESFVKSNKSSIANAYVFGGKFAVAESVYSKLKSASG